MAIYDPRSFRDSSRDIEKCEPEPTVANGQQGEVHVECGELYLILRAVKRIVLIEAISAVSLYSSFLFPRLTA
jgi:hypothetical protein